MSQRLDALHAVAAYRSTDEYQRLDALHAVVAYRSTDEYQRLDALHAVVAWRERRTWENIADAAILWYTPLAQAAAETVYVRHSFTVGGGAVTGATLYVNADYSATIYLNGTYLADYQADEDNAPASTVTIRPSRIRTGATNYLQAKVTTEAGRRGMIQFRLVVW